MANRIHISKLKRGHRLIHSGQVYRVAAVKVINDSVKKEFEVKIVGSKQALIFPDGRYVMIEVK